MRSFTPVPMQPENFVDRILRLQVTFALRAVPLALLVSLAAAAGCADEKHAPSPEPASPEPASPEPASLEPVSPEPLSQATREAIDSDILAVMQSSGTPGVQVAVVKADGETWSRAYGKAVLAPLTEVPMSSDTILQTSALSMMLVAVAVMQRVEAGAIGLDDDIATGLPWPVRNPAFPDAAITWRMALSHTSSINDRDEPVNGYFLGQDSPVSLSGFLTDVFSPTGRYYGSDTFLSTEPGAAFHFSNFGVGLAAYALELQLGQPFHQYVREKVLEPLGMQRASYFLSDLPSELLAVPYECGQTNSAAFTCQSIGPGSTVLEKQYSFADYPDGLLRASASEFGKLFSMLLNGGRSGETALLQPASVDALTAPSVPNGPGLSFFSMPGSDTAWGNVGNDRGAVVAAYFDRTTGVGALAFGNSQNTNPTVFNQLRPVVTRLLEAFR